MTTLDQPPTSTPPQEVRIHLPGGLPALRLSGGPDEGSLLQRIRDRNGSYERGVVRLLSRLVDRDAVVLDAGAHIGAIAMTIAVLAPRGVVHAVEPVPRTAALLDANIAANELTNVRVHRMAMTAATGQVRLDANPGFSAAARVDAEGEVFIPAVSLDDWVAQEGITRLDLVKANIEGSEAALIDGGTDTLTRLRPTLVLELSPPALRRVGGTDPRELYRRLAELYPLVYWVGRGGALVPVRDPDQLMQRLRRHGMGDIVATARRPRHGGAWALAGRVLAALPHVGPEHAVEPTLVVRGLVPVPARMPTNSRTLLPIELVNRCGSRLESRGHYPVMVAARWWTAAGRPLAEATRTPLPGTLRTGATQHAAVELHAPRKPGEYHVAVSLVHENWTWLDDLGPEAALRFTVQVEAPTTEASS
ncbi:MAG: FkbM family methyltransferase [Thermoleophilia bacterium]